MQVSQQFIKFNRSILKMQQSDINQANLKPIWYFTFGQSSKSSLLNQYSRQHSIKYLQKPSQEELSKYIDQQCIIQSDVNNLLEWQSKKQNISVIFIGKQFSEDELKIKSEYEQIGRCKYHSSLDNYEGFRKKMYPNLIFFFGPSKEHRQGAAATIAFQNLYKFVDKLPLSANQIISSYSKWWNYTFCQLFRNPKQIQILASRFNIKIVNFRYCRSDYPNEENYFDTEYEIVNFLTGKEYFISLDAHATPEVMMDQIGQFLCPKLIFINANNQTQKNYAKIYAQTKNTQLFSIFEIQAINKRKGIPLALNVQDKIRRINSIIYNDFNASQIILLDFPWHPHEFRLFQCINRKFSYFVDLDPDHQYLESSIYTSNLYFLQTQRRIHPNLQFPLVNQIQSTKKYWMIVGAPASGKSTVSKYLQTRYNFLTIEFEPYIASLKQKLLAPEDGQELPIRKIIAHFKDLLQKNPQKQFAFDGFNYSNEALKDWIRQIGVPTVLNLRVDENQLIKRLRKKAEADQAGEVTQQQIQKAREGIEKQSQWIEKLNEVTPDSIIYSVDFNFSMILAERFFQSILQPRVFLVQTCPTLVFQNIAIRYNCCFINLAIYSLEQAKKIVKSSEKRDVIIANYRQTEHKMISEDLYWIQKNIGKIRYLTVWAGEEKACNEEKIHLERPIQQKKPKQTLEGDEVEDQPPEQPAQEEGEAKKKKLDIYAYEWSKPISHKNLSQWYFKLKKYIEEFSTEPSEAYKAFKQKLDKINSDPNLHIYEVLKPKQIQFY